MDFFKKYKKYIYSILTDIICVFGVILFSWNVLNIMLFYWLDIALMVVFIAFYMKKVNKISYNISMLMGVLMMFFFLSLLYYGIIFFGESIGYKSSSEFLLAFQPNFMIPVFLCTSALNNFKEYKYFENQLENKTKEPYKYPMLLVLRLFSIEALLVIGALIEADTIVTLIMIFILKLLLLVWEQRKPSTS